MSDHYGPGDLDPSAAERLLDGAGGDARLHAVLSAAAAPAHPEELAGEDAAVAAFKAAPRPARTSRAAALRRFLTVKAVVLVGGSLILSGGAVAYAAKNGHLPGSDSAPSPSQTLDREMSTGENRGAVTPATSVTSSASAPPTATDSPSTSGSPAASKKPGTETAPGRQKKTQAPGGPPQPPPTGPGNNNGSPPGENSGNGNNGNGQGNGTGNNGSPPDQNSGNGNENGPPG
ncbi:hypothetical protein ACN3XK_00855 [Actinomadura welshii]